MDPATAVGTFDFALPSLGADMDAGKVLEWCVDIGDTGIELQEASVDQ